MARAGREYKARQGVAEGFLEDERSLRALRGERSKQGSRD